MFVDNIGIHWGHSLICTFQPQISILWQIYSSILNVYIPIANRVLINPDDIKSMNCCIPSLMNCISTKIYADHYLSIKFPSRMQKCIHPVETQKNWNRKMRLRRFKLKNGCHATSSHLFLLNNPNSN